MFMFSSPTPSHSKLWLDDNVFVYFVIYNMQLHVDLVLLKNIYFSTIMLNYNGACFKWIKVFSDYFLFISLTQEKDMCFLYIQTIHFSWEVLAFSYLSCKTMIGLSFYFKF